MTDLRALAIFARTLLLVFVQTGLGPAIAIAIFWERFRVTEIGFEKVSRGGWFVQHQSRFDTSSVNPWASSPSRKASMA